MERMCTDINSLKKQYNRLKQRQNQAHIIIAGKNFRIWYMLHIGEFLSQHLIMTNQLLKLCKRLSLNCLYSQRICEFEMGRSLCLFLKNSYRYHNSPVFYILHWLIPYGKPWALCNLMKSVKGIRSSGYDMKWPAFGAHIWHDDLIFSVEIKWHFNQ